ncbi:MAG: CBS domain-containing protein [Chloroflexota bacterium]|jgi:CBS domain-containing protein
MTTIRQLLAVKGADVWSISPEATVYEALSLLAEKNIGALLVLQDDDIAGIVSERDYARKVALRGKASMRTPVSEIMTGEVVTVEPELGIRDALALMTERHIRHLPVVEGANVVGFVSIGDLVKSIIADQELLIAQLEQYISGTQT